jgi:hypothetical protein
VPFKHNTIPKTRTEELVNPKEKQKNFDAYMGAELTAQEIRMRDDVEQVAHLLNKKQPIVLERDLSEKNNVKLGPGDYKQQSVLYSCLPVPIIEPIVEAEV